MSAFAQKQIERETMQTQKTLETILENLKSEFCSDRYDEQTQQIFKELTTKEVAKLKNIVDFIGKE
tara:strand:- start:764 stop:961 length:198 start_codon:yes stop_codon:yes gene_type:complete